METLPPELIRLITECLDSDRDISSFARTSWSLYHQIINYLYKNCLRKDRFNHWGPKPLQWACANGNERTLKLALRNLNDPASSGYYYGLAFHYACKHGDQKLATRFLIKLRKDPVQHEEWVQAAIPCAAEEGHESIIRLLIKEGALTKPSANIGLALAESAGSGHLGIVKLLIKGGADINDFNEDYIGGTALTWAAADDHNDVVKYLLRKGADVQDDGNCGLDALQLAALYGHLNMVKTLVNHGAQVDDVTPNSEDGNTALLTAVEEGHEDIVDFLLDKGANVYHRNHFGQSALDIAAGNGNINIAKVLINHGAIIGAVGLNDEIRDTPLFLAVQEGHMDVIRMLLNEGALGRPLNL